MKKPFLLFFGFLVLAYSGFGQDLKTHSHAVSLNFLQIKDELNYGLVFKGPGAGYSFSAQWENDQRILDYEGHLLLNLPFTRKILAGSADFVPARFGYQFKPGGSGKYSIGPYAVIEYNYDFYPDLQSIYYFWFTNFSLGCAATRSYKIKNSNLDLALHFTAFGLTSRVDYPTDPYFNEIKFGSVMKDMHSDLKFGSWNLYNVSELEIRWTPKTDSKLAWGYSFQYCGYYEGPTITTINQSVKLYFLPKK